MASFYALQVPSYGKDTRLVKELGTRETAEALCAYEECRFCVHRANASKTPNGEGQCNLELQGRAPVSLCRGRLFFSLSPDRTDKYRSWVRAGCPRSQPV